MKILLIILIALVLLYVVSVRGRTGHPGMKALQGWYYAHRGLHDETLPENSMAAFRAALEKGYGVELDIHLMKDGNLAVIHDSSLKRTAGCDIHIEDMTTEQLKNYHLEGTQETIPEFREVLELFQGKAPLIIELKAAKGNQAALADAACAMMEGYEGPWCMESFDPRCVYRLRKCHPQVIRGQLTANFFKDRKSDLSPILKWALKHQVFNIMTHPDFTAYKFEDRKAISNTLVRKLWGVQGVSWTIRSREDADTAVKEGWLPIFENFDPLCSSQNTAGPKTMTYEKMMARIPAEGLDQDIDFQLDKDSAVEGSIRLNKKDGQYVLYKVGQQGISYTKTFENPEEAYYAAVTLLRSIHKER